MPGRRHQGEIRRRKQGERAGVKLAVYHATGDVDDHVAALRRARRFRLACLPQPMVSARAWAKADAVLWELAPGHKPNRRQIQAMARRTPIVSYSADAGREVLDLSRAAGFVSHLRAPLRPVEVEHRLALVAPSDLATRLRQFQSTLRRHLGRADILMEFGRAVNASAEPARVAEALVARSAAWLPVPTLGVMTGDQRTGVHILAVRHAEGIGEEAHDAALAAAGAWVLHRAEPFAVADVRAAGLVTSGPPVAAVGFPLISRGRTVGALVGVDRRRSLRPPRLGSATTVAIGRVCEIAGMALDSALRLQHAAALTVTDDLTRLYNARYLGQVLHRESKRAARNGRPLSVLFIDLDGFKGVNDAYGHLNGSRALTEAGLVIRGSARETDIVARYGGDEFTIVLPETDSEGARAVAERVRERIAAHTFLTEQALSVRLTASVGVATLPDVAGSGSALLQAADHAMYWVKEHGKNGIFVAALGADLRTASYD